jgi:hypothetical protein
MDDQDQKKAPEASSDMLTTAAEAIGSTLGKLAVKTGIAKPPARAPKRRKPAGKKKAPVKKIAVRTGRKTASKRESPKKPARGKQKK